MRSVHASVWTARGALGPGGSSGTPRRRLRSGGSGPVCQIGGGSAVAGGRPQEVIFPFAVPVTEPSAAIVPDSVPDPVAPA